MFHFRMTMMVVLMAISLHTHAQKNQNFYSLSGKVTDDSNNPLPSASIYISELRRGTISDSSGNFVLKNIPEGSYLVSAEYSGFHSVLQNIQFVKDTRINFRLKQAITEEKEIVITTALQATSLKRNPVPIINISKNFLNQNITSNVISALANVPGLSAVTTGPNVAKPFIRGLGYNRVLTLFDGVRIENQQWGDEHGVAIDENTISRIEIIKGPASLLYGSDAMAGVINFIPLAEPSSGKKYGNASLMYQTNNNLIEGTANASGRGKDLSWGITGTHKMAADYQNRIDGRVYNTGFKESSLFFQSALNKKWGYSRLGASYNNNVQEIPDGKRDSASRKFEKEISEDNFMIVPSGEFRSYSISPIHQQIQYLSVYNVTNFLMGKGRFETQAGFQKSIRQEFDDPESTEAGLHLVLNTLTYGLKYSLPKFKNLSVTTGLNGMLQYNDVDKGTEFLIPDYRQFDMGPFVYARITKNKSEWAGGIRYDLRHFTNQALYIRESGGKDVPVYGNDTLNSTKLFSDFRHTFGGLSGSVGYSHRFNSQWNIKVNIARGFRAPNISEISSNGIHSGSKIYQLGNENFKPELSLQQDVNINFNSEHVTIDAAIFNNNIKNYIFNQKLLTPSGEDSVIVSGYETFQYTASHAELYGGELSVDLHPHPLDWLHFENTLSMVFARNTGNKGQQVSDDEKYLPFIPPIHGRSELRAAFKTLNNKRLKNLFAKVQMDYYASQNRVFSINNTETPTPGYNLFNAGLGTDVTGKNGKTLFTLNVIANNLFNTTYQSNMSRLKYFEDYPDDPRGHHGIYEMGRNISIKINVPFQL